MFGDGINFKHYRIQNAYSLKRQNIEQKFILDVEQKAARKLGREVIRNSHTGTFYDTISPTLIVEKP